MSSTIRKAFETALGGTNNEGLHLLFQVQCDQLKQFCQQTADNQRGQHLLRAFPASRPAPIH
jgi:hypothetical protein